MLNTTEVNGGLLLNGGFRSNSFPQVVVNPRFPNLLYMVFNDCSSSPCATAVDKANIYLSKSGNGGATWLAPIKINDDATTRDQFFPTIAISDDGLRLFIAWYDRRNSPTNSLIERFGTGASIAPSGAIVGQGNRLISNAAFPVVVGQDPLVNPTYMGDYDQVVARGRTFYGPWGDNRLPNPNVPAILNQPDVRFATVTVP
jgi:hypothetical protein